MSVKTYKYDKGKSLLIQRNNIVDSSGNILFEGAMGKIKLGDILSSEGGEGLVYRLDSIKSSEFDGSLANIFVAKIYLDSEIASSKKNKILAMLDMLNNFVDDESLNNVCWPYYAIYDDNTFVGYIMPKATGKTLANLFYPVNKFFASYTRTDLVQICLNIINKINQLHSHGIIIGDINEDNFIINSPSEIYFIDTDSYQFKNYLCIVERLEYKAPTLIENDNNKLTFTTEGYSTAVLIFKILMLGKHPFSCKNAEEMEMEERIVKGLFPYSIDKKITENFAPNGPSKYIWEDFTRDLKLFFIDIFTRADELNSVKDIKIYLENYLKELEKVNKTDLIPVQFANLLNKLREEEQENKTIKNITNNNVVQVKNNTVKTKKVDKKSNTVMDYRAAVKKIYDNNGYKKYLNNKKGLKNAELSRIILNINSVLKHELDIYVHMNEPGKWSYIITSEDLDIKIKKNKKRNTAQNDAWTDFFKRISKF